MASQPNLQSCSAAAAPTTGPQRNLLAELPPALLHCIADPTTDLMAALALHLSCKALYRRLGTDVWRPVVCAHANTCHAETLQMPGGQQEDSWHALYLRHRPLCLACSELAVTLEQQCPQQLPTCQRLAHGVLCGGCWQQHQDLRLMWHGDTMQHALPLPVYLMWCWWVPQHRLGECCYYSQQAAARLAQLCSVLWQHVGRQLGQGTAAQQPQRPAADGTAQPSRVGGALGLLKQQAQGQPGPALDLLMSIVMALEHTLPRLGQFVAAARPSDMLQAVETVLGRHRELLAALLQQGLTELPSGHHSKLCAQYLSGFCTLTAQEVALKVAQSRFLRSHTDFEARRQELRAKEHFPGDDELFDDVNLLDGGGTYRLTWREAGELAKQEALEPYGGDFPRPWPWQQVAPAGARDV